MVYCFILQWIINEVHGETVKAGRPPVLPDAKRPLMAVGCLSNNGGQSQGSGQKIHFLKYVFRCIHLSNIPSGFSFF